MPSYRLCFALIVLIIQTCLVYGQEEDRIIKSSLTFVIDDTASMWNEIHQVKQEVNIIFEKVLSSNESQIENFVLITFNDPYAETRTITRDRNEFKSALAAINVHGGGDCPEYAMTGIELALTESLPLSYLYVFTDASARDFAKFEQVKSISQKKQSQVVFILTGECGLETDADFQVYYKLAEATAGQVFHMMKDDVKDILKYIEETITGRGVTLVDKKLPPGYGKKIKYPVDSHTGDVLISVTGKEPVIGEVTGPDGSKPATEHIVRDKDEMAVVKVVGAKPGDHEVEVGSKSETHAIISAKTDLNFQLGFAVFLPTSIGDTVSRPAPEGNAFLGIKVLGDGLELITAKILDMSDNVITELPVTLVDGKSQFYVTPSFNPPFTMFRVSITGKDVKTKTPLTRMAPTPIQRQNLDTEKKENIAPQVNIEGAPTVSTWSGDPLVLKCKVHGYPPPDIIWEELDTGNSLPAKVQVVEVPYDYVSILDIEAANKNITYQCKASNPFGVVKKVIEVVTKIKYYFDVIEVPKDIRVEYKKGGSIVCKINANPPASITWYKDGKVLTNNSNIDISSDNSVLYIKDMQPHIEGVFMCEARNDMNRKVFYSNVVIFGIEKPVIDKSRELIRVPEQTNAELSCRLLKGIPKPSIRWSFKPVDKEKFRKMNETSETIHLEKVHKDLTGLFRCVAENIKGTDNHAIQLIVEYPPQIKSDVTSLKSKDGEELNIPCEVSGEPAPLVKWYFNGTRLDNTTKYRISTDHSLKLKATLADTGYYTCDAENKLDRVEKSVFVNIFVPVTIDPPEKGTIEMMVGKSEILYCRADGYPKPEIIWIFRSSDPETPPKVVTSIGGLPSLPLKNVQLDQQGFYDCVAENDISGSANITYEVIVLAPPVIINEYTHKTFDVVNGDLVLRIRCKATGSPKPIITWKKNDLNLALGSEWYEMEEDGTLVIKNIDFTSQGTYVCLAENKLGQDSEMYEVNVKNASAERPTRTIFVEEGKSIDIKCDLEHGFTDQLRWYKDGSIYEGGKELHLYHVTRNDDGLYTCRVSNMAISRAVTTKLVVGFKPEFITTEEETIEFIEGADPVVLSCEAYGEPMPKYASWKHNGIEQKTESMSYSMAMILGATGVYECEVSNEFGTIRRSFNVTSRDCILNIKTDFPEKHPLMYSSALGWPVFRVTDGYMVIPKADYFYLYCPSKFSNFRSGTKVIAFCEGDRTVKIFGNNYDFAEIKCKREITPEIYETGRECLSANTEYIKIGYRMFNKFLEAYGVCLDKDNNVALFAEQSLSPDHSDTTAESQWYNNYFPQDFDELYDCRRQAHDIASSLGHMLRSPDSCCFAKRQMVSPRNLLPGIPTSAAFEYLNVIPHWSTCNSKNWDDVEERVRNLVKTAGHDLMVATGVSNPVPRLSADITLRDGSEGNQTVPQYLWKIVQDITTATSLAIIQVNIPELSPAEASKYVLCPDICNYTHWMKGPNWRNVDDGYTFCCSITEFEKRFGFIGRFSPDMEEVLFKVDLIPDISV